MLFSNIKELTIIGDEVTINGVQHVVSSMVKDGIRAVQYHKGRKLLEETDNGFVEADEAKYQPFIDEWEDIQNQLEAEMLANKPTEAELVMRYATNAIDKAIQDEIDAYNKANGIALSSVHNAESYSRVTTYSHRDFCSAVWLWSVELWEFMRAWQDTLTGLPTQTEIDNKIAEKPFIFQG